MNGIFYGVSVGPGDPELITLKAVKRIQSCPVIAVPSSKGESGLIAWEIAKQSVSEIDDKEQLELELPMTKDLGQLEKQRRDAAEKVIVKLKQGKDVAFLTIGDASIYSTYTYLQKLVEERGFRTETVAGVPSFCAAAARVGSSLVEWDKPLHLIPASFADVSECLSWEGTKVLMKMGKSLQKTVQAIGQNGSSGKTQLVQNCGLKNERVFASLEENGDIPEGYLSIIIVKE